MKKILIMLSLILTVCAVKAQSVNPKGFAGKNIDIYLEPNTTKTVWIGINDGGGDCSYYWEVEEQPDGASTHIGSPNTHYTNVSINAEGRYKYKLTRLSEYGYQSEYVFVTADSDFQILSATTNNKLYEVNSQVSAFDFNFVTNPQLDVSDCGKYIICNPRYLDPDFFEAGLFGDNIVRVYFIKRIKDANTGEFVERPTDIFADVMVHTDMFQEGSTSDADFGNIPKKAPNQFSNDQKNDHEVIGAIVDVAAYPARTFWNLIYNHSLPPLISKSDDGITESTTGGWNYRLSRELYRSENAFKIDITGTVNSSVNVDKEYEVNLKVPLVDKIKANAKLQMTTTLDSDFTYYAGAKFFDFNVSKTAPINMTGGIKLVGEGLDASVASAEGEVVIDANPNARFDKNGLELDSKKNKMEARFYVTLISSEVIEYVFPLSEK